MLSNLYLHLLDRIWERHQLARELQASLVRYADDFVVLCRHDTAKPLAVVQRILAKLELDLNEAKTQTVNALDARFRFLGFELGMSRSHSGNLTRTSRPPAKRWKRAKRG